MQVARYRVKFSLFQDYVLSCRENPKVNAKTILHLILCFRNFYQNKPKANQSQLAFKYSNELSEREIEVITLKTTAKKMSRNEPCK